MGTVNFCRAEKTQIAQCVSIPKHVVIVQAGVQCFPDDGHDGITGQTERTRRTLDLLDPSNYLLETETVEQ